jgi:hypothetical protein
MSIFFGKALLATNFLNELNKIEDNTRVKEVGRCLKGTWQYNTIRTKFTNI